MNIFRNMLYMARRFKTATVLNFIGLTVAFAACYLFLTQVVYSHSYNKGLTNYEQLYRVEVPGMASNREWQSHVSRYIAEQLAAMPQVETMALMTGYNNCTAKKDLTEYSFSWCRVNNDALATFAPRLLDGDITWKDGDQKGLVIPASIAMQYFGSVQVAGRHMMWESGDSAMIRGVFADFPENCSVRNCIYSNMRDENQGNINNYNDGEEYDYLIDFQSVEEIDLLVRRIDGTLAGEPVGVELTAIEPSPDKYTWHIKSYVGKNLATFGYTSIGEDRMDEYGHARVKFVLVTDDGSLIDPTDEEALKQYYVTAQDVAPNSEMHLTFMTDSSGEEYSNLVDTQSYKSITLYVKKLPDEVLAAQ